MNIKEKNLVEALSLSSKEVISVIGGGGKTTFVNYLSKELYSMKKAVISTTTTKIFPPQTGDKEVLLFTTEPYWLNKVDSFLREGKLIHIAMEILSNGKLKGLSKKLCCDILNKANVDYLIIEADGAGGKSLKVHSTWEPVVPECTTLFISVIGIDSLMKRIDEEHVHRSNLLQSKFNLPKKAFVDIDLIVKLFEHPRGYLSTIPPKARSFVFINKVHEPGEMQSALELGQKLLLMDRVDGVIIGHLKPLCNNYVLLSK